LSAVGRKRPLADGYRPQAAIRAIGAKQTVERRCLSGARDLGSTTLDFAIGANTCWTHIRPPRRSSASLF